MGGLLCTPASAVVRRRPRGRGRAVHGHGYWSYVEREPGTGGEPGTGEAAVTGGRGTGTGGRPGTGVAEREAGTGVLRRLGSAGASSGRHHLGEGLGPFPHHSVPTASGQGRTWNLGPALSAGQRAWAGWSGRGLSCVGPRRFAWSL